VKKENATLNRGDLAELISNMWDKLDKSVREEYQHTYDKNIDKYKKDLEEYQKIHGKIKDKASKAT